MALKYVGSRKYSNVRRHLSRVYYVSYTKHHRFCDENRPSRLRRSNLKQSQKCGGKRYLHTVASYRNLFMIFIYTIEIFWAHLNHCYAQGMTRLYAGGDRYTRAISFVNSNCKHGKILTYSTI